MTNTPVLTIGIPVYNGGAYLAQTLDSLLAQDYTDFRLVISDNGSSDGTEAICRRYAAKDKRIVYYRQQINRGSTWNFDFVFAKSFGEFFMWAAHDDVFLPAYLRTCLSQLESSLSIVLAGTACDYIDGKTSTRLFIDPGVATTGLKAAERFRHYKKMVHDQTCTNAIFYGVYRRAVLEQCMPLENMIASDHLLLARLALLGEFATSPQVLMVKRRGGASATFDHAARVFGIQGTFAGRCPYFVRELALQKIIRTTKALTAPEKASLASWSWRNYIVLFTKMMYWCVRDGLKRVFKGRPASACIC